MEELMKIKDIGETRSKLIINARTAKGSLILEDLKMIEGVPNTI
jgi:DNA uptake protein ComE-like DNA-binding protein